MICASGIAASGRTPYVLSAINYANSIGALTEVYVVLKILNCLV